MIGYSCLVHNHHINEPPEYVMNIGESETAGPMKRLVLGGIQIDRFADEVEFLDEAKIWFSKKGWSENMDLNTFPFLDKRKSSIRVTSDYRGKYL